MPQQRSQSQTAQMRRQNQRKTDEHLKAHFWTDDLRKGREYSTKGERKTQEKVGGRQSMSDECGGDPCSTFADERVNRAKDNRHSFAEGKTERKSV